MNEAVVRLLERPGVYLAWQRPFVATKLGSGLAPQRPLDDPARAGRGLRPGNEQRRVRRPRLPRRRSKPVVHRHARRQARRRSSRSQTSAPTRCRDEATYDFVLVNSLLHHLDDDRRRRRFSRISADYVSDDGHIHVIDLELPEQRGVPRVLGARGSRRLPAEPSSLAQPSDARFDEVVFEPFAVPARGPMLWSMVYFKGRPKADD